MITSQIPLIYHLTRYILLGFISFATFAVNGQTSDDDLAVLLGKHPQIVHDSIYYEGFRSCFRSDTEKAIGYADRAFQLSRVYNHSLIHCKASHALAYLYGNRNNEDSAVQYFHRAIKIASQNNFQERLAYIYIDLGIMYERTDVYDSALYYFVNCSNLAAGLNMQIVQANALHNIGTVLYNIENYDDALSYLEQSVHLKRELGVNDEVNTALLNIAQIYAELNHYDKAIDRLKEVEANCQNKCDDGLMAVLQYRFAFAYLKRNQLVEAQNLFEKSVQLSRQSNKRQILAHALYHLAAFSADIKEYDRAFQYLYEAEEISKELNHRRLRRDIYQRLSEIYSKTRSLDKVIYYQRLHEEVKDSIFNPIVAENIKAIELNEQQRKSDQVVQQKEAEVKESRIIIILIGVICLLAFVVALLLHKLSNSNRLELLRETLAHEEINRELSRSQLDFNYLSYCVSSIHQPLSNLLSRSTVVDSDARDMILLKLNQLSELRTLRDQGIFIEEIRPDELLQDVSRSIKDEKKYPLISLKADPSFCKKLSTDREQLVHLVVNLIRQLTGKDEVESIEVLFEQSDEFLTVSISERSGGDRVTVQNDLFSLFMAQIEASRLRGHVVIAEKDGHFIYRLTLPLEYNEQIEAESLKRQTA